MCLREAYFRYFKYVCIFEFVGIIIDAKTIDKIQEVNEVPYNATW